MSWTYRSGVLFIALAFVTAGCDSKGSSGAAGGADGYGKKLVGTWEGEPEGDKKDEKVTVEFKADGSVKLTAGPFDKAGTYKVTKEDGKVVSFDMELTLPFGDEKDKGKAETKTFTATFDDADTITMTPTDKPDPKKLKRKK